MESFRLLYSDFAFSQSMQVILVILSVLATFIQCYMPLELLYNVLGEKVAFSKKVSVAIFLMLFHELSIYIPFALSGFDTLGDYLYIFSTPGPLIPLLLYFLAVKFLKISKYRIIHALQPFYLSALFMICLSRTVNFFLFPQGHGPYNYMTDAASVIVGALVNIVLCSVARALIKKNGLTIVLTDSILLSSLPKRLARVLLLSAFAYLVIVQTETHSHSDPIVMLHTSLTLCLFVVVSLLSTLRRADKANLQNSAAHIHALNSAVYNFQSVRHDFYNILNTYSGYISLNSMEGLKKYHERLTKMTVEAGDEMELASKMDQNPALCSLLLQKCEMAKSLDLQMAVKLNCPVDSIAMDNFDLCRVLACLLDNALEAAVSSENKQVNVIFEPKVHGGRLIIITNSLDWEVPLTKISEYGYTTKENHGGIGLAQVRSVLSGYKNCGIQFTYYDKQFTAYLEITGPGPGRA